MDAQQKLIDSLEIFVKTENVEIDDLSVHCIVAGSGKPVILLHGLNMGWGQWYANIAALARNFTVYALSLPGSGQSTFIDINNFDSDKHLVDVVEKFINLHNLDSVCVVGHSLSAWAAIKVAERSKKIVKVVLIGPVGFVKKTPYKFKLLGIRWVANFLARQIMPITKLNIKKFLEDVFFDHKNLNEEFTNYYYELLDKKPSNHPFLITNRISGFFNVRQQFIFNYDIIKIPIMVILGKYDPIINWREAKMNILRFAPWAEVVLMEKSGHVPFIEQAEEFNQLVNKFLQRL